MLDRVEKDAIPLERLDKPLRFRPRVFTQDDGPAVAEPARNDRRLERLRGRRWLVAASFATGILLHYVFGLPWDGVAVSLASFLAGAALIPGDGLVTVVQSGNLDDAEEAASHSMTKRLIEALPEPAVLLSSSATILSFNAKAIDLFGGLKDGAHISSAIRNPQVLTAVSRCCADEPAQTVTFTDRVPVERYMAATVSFLEGYKEADQPAILVFLRDLTEQRRLDQLRSDFIANASHEIKTPLASILGFIETLQGAARNDADARDRFLGIMAKQAARMARLIDNLMSLSRVEMRAHLKPQDQIKISELVAQACDALEPMAAEAEMKMVIASEVAGVTVLGDKDELTQVFINLIQNAVKYGRKGGHIRVTTSRVVLGGVPHIEASVEDDGPGIAPQHLPRLTERFYRAPGALAFERGGTGLGLAIVKHVVNRHRGELRIHSEEGKGAKFTILLAEHVV